MAKLAAAQQNGYLYGNGQLITPMKALDYEAHEAIDLLNEFGLHPDQLDAILADIGDDHALEALLATDGLTPDQIAQFVTEFDSSLFAEELSPQDDKFFEAVVQDDIKHPDQPAPNTNDETEPSPSH